MQEIEVKLSDIVFREDIYPRIEHSQRLAQEYSENISLLPPIEINQKNELIDGRHRHIAHQLAGQKVIKAFVTETKDDTDLLRLAIQRNSAHGFQLSMPDKRKLALRFYNDAAQEYRGHVEKELPGLLSVAPRTVAGWLADTKSETQRERNSAILQLHLQCRTQQEIGEAVGMTRQNWPRRWQARRTRERLAMLCLGCPVRQNCRSGEHTKQKTISLANSNNGLRGGPFFVRDWSEKRTFRFPL